MFGGTFDPIHKGHLAIARFALAHGDLEMVLLVPAGKPWLRSETPSALAQDRLQMTKLAVAGEPGLEASDVDVAREGATYTVDTLRDLRERYEGGTEFVLIVGVDAALSMNRWHRASELADLCSILVIGRPGQSWAEDLPIGHPAHAAEFSEGPMIDISATKLRAKLVTGQDVAEELPAEVAAYIEHHELYR